MAAPFGLLYASYLRGLSLAAAPSQPAPIPLDTPGLLKAWHEWDRTSQPSVVPASVLGYGIALFRGLVLHDINATRAYHDAHPGFLASQHIVRHSMAGVSMRSFSRRLAEGSRAIWLTQHWSAQHLSAYVLRMAREQPTKAFHPSVPNPGVQWTRYARH
jgi:hypothetical protein